MAGSEIVDLITEAQFRDAVSLQRTIWAFENDEDLLPVRFFVVANKVGGQVFGAYEGDHMIAFLLAIPGFKPGLLPYLHSHMLGVLEPWRNTGIGRRLKLHQKAHAIARGIPLIEWTFDPFELRNAWFNIERLGCIVRKYVRNQYGPSSSALARGLPTDRLIAEWWVGNPAIRPPVVDRIRVTALRTLAVQEEMAAHFEAAFAGGLTVFGIERFEGGIDYLLGVVELKEEA